MKIIKALVTVLTLSMMLIPIANAKPSKGLFRKWKSGTLNCHAVLWYSSSSSSTSDSCDHIMFIVQNKKEEIHNFVDANYDSLMEDMSRGEGSFVNDYALILGCSDTAHFSQITKENFSSIYSGSRDPQVILNNTLSTMGANSKLRESCQLAI